jgi:hypothetical protein
MTNCGGWEAITVSPRDKLTRKTEEKIVSHNEFGERQGCWKP